MSKLTPLTWPLSIQLRPLLHQGIWQTVWTSLMPFFHVPIHPSHRKFFRFCFQNKFYQFRAMPFGYDSAPCIFTKLTRPIALFCRQKGIRILFYLDDSLILAQSRDQSLAHRDFVLDLLASLGFLVNLDKSDLTPTKSSLFWGLLWDTVAMSSSLPLDKIAKLVASALALLSRPAPSCLSLQKFLGSTNFASVAVPRAHLNSRFFLQCGSFF